MAFNGGYITPSIPGLQVHKQILVRDQFSVFFQLIIDRFDVLLIIVLSVFEDDVDNHLKLTDKRITNYLIYPHMKGFFQFYWPVVVAVNTSLFDNFLQIRNILIFDVIEYKIRNPYFQSDSHFDDVVDF